jgi:archaellum component FlaC
MTIDERLDRLTERHEALTQSVELLTSDVRELTTDTVRMRGIMDELMTGFRAMTALVRSHEQRLEGN